MQIPLQASTQTIRLGVARPNKGGFDADAFSGDMGRRLDDRMIGLPMVGTKTARKTKANNDLPAGWCDAAPATSTFDVRPPKKGSRLS